MATMRSPSINQRVIASNAGSPASWSGSNGATRQWRSWGDLQELNDFGAGGHGVTTPGTLTQQWQRRYAQSAIAAIDNGPSARAVMNAHQIIAGTHGIHGPLPCARHARWQPAASATGGPPAPRGQPRRRRATLAAAHWAGASGCGSSGNQGGGFQCVHHQQVHKRQRGSRPRAGRARH